MMFGTSMIGSVLSMKCDVYVQKNKQSSSGAIEKEWVYFKTIPCVIESMPSGGPFKGDDKKFINNQEWLANPYVEILEIKMKSVVPLSKRWRISGIKANNGQSVYTELDRYGEPDTIFEVKASHAQTDPFGNVSHYHSNLSRIVVQKNDKNSP